LFHVGGVCVGAATNNQAKENVVIGLLVNALQCNIHHIRVHLDSQLLIAQLNNRYQVRNPALFRKYV